MTWLPSFLNPWTAAIAASIAVPALLVLYFLKLRRREMPVSSTLLWRKAIQDLQVNAPRRSLKTMQERPTSRGGRPLAR